MIPLFSLTYFSQLAKSAIVLLPLRECPCYKHVLQANRVSFVQVLSRRRWGSPRVRQLQAWDVHKRDKVVEGAAGSR